MELSFEQSVALKQHQTLSQSQIQSLEVLSMDSVELKDFLQQEYLENPLLDYVEKEKSVSEQRIDDYSHLDYISDNYSDNDEQEAEKTSGREIPVKDADRIRMILLEQLQRKKFSKKQWSLIEYMIDCLEDSGYFTVPLEEVARKNNIDIEETEAILRLLQGLEPAGIFAFDLKECLLIQLQNQGKQESNTYHIVENYLEEIAKGKINQISRGMKISTADVRKSMAEIARLNPHPLNALVLGTTEYIVPDILVERQQGEWEITLNDSWVENYQLNEYYLQMIPRTQDEELRTYFEKKLEKIRLIQKNIRQRRETLIMITEIILKRQEDYALEKGALLPMTMNDIAQELDIHNSTVSRAIKGKYIQLPGKTVLMKNLFSISISTSAGQEEIGAEQIKIRMKELIKNEDKKKPYSDQKISNLLAEEGIRVSRRAINKYRQELGIPDKSGRTR